MKMIDLCPEVQAKNPSVEANLLKSLEHPNIVKCYETYQEEDHLGLIMEFCEKGNFFQQISDSPRRPSPES
jgi:serine/threonine protein kinase